MAEAVSAILPMALAAALGPLPVVMVILLLGSAAPLRNASLAVLGWFIPFLVVCGIAYAAARAGRIGAGSDSSRATVVRVVLGVALLGLAVRQWLQRPPPGETAQPPGWLAEIDSFGAGRSFRAGLLLAGLDPTNLVFSIGAATAIAQTGIAPSGGWLAVLVYALLSSSTIAAPVVYYAAAGGHAEARLSEVEHWLEANADAVTLTLLLVLGVVFLSNGLTGLFG